MAKKEVVSRLPALGGGTKKKKSNMETPLEKRQKLPTYSDKYEESLIKQLFEEELQKKLKEKADEEESEYYEESSSKHIKRKDGNYVF